MEVVVELVEVDSQNAEAAELKVGVNTSDLLQTAAVAFQTQPFQIRLFLVVLQLVGCQRRHKLPADLEH